MFPPYTVMAVDCLDQSINDSLDLVLGCASWQASSHRHSPASLELLHGQGIGILEWVNRNE